MNVSTTGIQGYEYQYKITLLIYLIYHADKMQLFVEKEGNEDALLVLEHNNIELRIQIQVKHEQGSLDTVKLVKWLSHFEERRDNASLLQRLNDKKDDIVLFATRSRCDDTVFLKSEIDRLSIHEDLKLSKEQKLNILTALEQMKHGTTKLMQARESFDSELAQILKLDKKLEEVLARVVIWEEFSDAKVNSAITNILTSRHQIATSLANVAYLELLEVIKEGRNQQHNIQPELRAVIQRRKIGRPITELNYFERGDEKNLLDILLDNKVLLLTGLTLCGKSEVAKSLATSLIDSSGYNYHQTSDVKDLKRFLATDISDHKITILEDPWGHLNLSPGYEAIWREIEHLLQNLQKHHNVIITTSLQRLFELNQTDDLQYCKIVGLPWVDLTERSPTKANGYWRAIALQKKLDDPVVKLVSNNLLASSGDHLLQIGQLKFLANYEKSELHNRSFHELEHIARRSSREIADWIYGKDPYHSEVLGVLAMVSTSIISVNKSHLGFIFSSETPRPSFIDKDKSSVFLEDEDRQFPKYKTIPALDQRTSTALEFLEERQLIKISGDEYLFTHPNYYEAGRFSFFGRSQSSQQRLLEYLIKSVACTSPDNAYLAARKFQFIYNRLRSDLKPKLIDIGFSSVNSVFPSVEDTSVAFLSNNIRDIHDDQLDKLIGLIQRGGTSSDNISWHVGSIPFISYEQGIDKLFFVPNEAAVNRAEELLNSRTLPPVQDGWELLESLKDGRDVPSHYFQLLLSYKETFMRKRVVLQFFRRLNESGVYLLEEIFNDEHPSVVFSAIRGAFLFWKNFKGEVKSLLIEYITKAMSKEQVAIRASNLISTFATDYASEGIYTWDEMNEVERRELWSVWGIVYPIMANNLPPDGVFINSARFGATMDESIKYLEKEIGIKVFIAWFERIDRQIAKGVILDEFEMSVAASLMEFTKGDFQSRKQLFSKLLTYHDTSFMISSLKWIIQFWDDLHESEQNEILSLPNSGREDVRWINAVLLTSSYPPQAVVKKILGEPDIFQKDVPYILSKMPSALLQDCLNVFCGFPQPLWSLAIHHKNRELWVKILTHILTNNHPHSYETALREFLFDGVNGFPPDKWDKPEQLWYSVCQNTTDKKILAELVIYSTASCSCNIEQTQALWSILRESYVSLKKQDEFIEVIASNIEMLQQTGHREDLIKILGKDFLLTDVLSKITPDIILINLIDTFSSLKVSTDDEITNVFEGILKIIETKHIRFFFTFAFIRHVQTNENLPLKVRELLGSLPDIITEIGRRERDRWDQKFEFPLNNWTMHSS